MVAERIAKTSQVIESQDNRSQPLCPVCAGPLVPLGNTWRCARCCFTLCDGCEAGGAVCFSASRIERRFLPPRPALSVVGWRQSSPQDLERRTRP